MKAVKTLFVIIILTLGIFPGCGSDPEECERMVARYFDIFGIEVQHARGDAFNAELLPSGSSILFANYRGFHILPNVELYGMRTTRKKSILSEFSIISSAWAGVFIPGDQGSETEMLTDISVTTLNDFNEQYPAGSNIEEVISVRIGENIIPLQEFLSSKQNDLIQLADLPYVLIPTIEPSRSNPFQVRVQFDLSTGETYEATSGEVNFLEN